MGAKSTFHDPRLSVKDLTDRLMGIYDIPEKNRSAIRTQIYRILKERTDRGDLRFSDLGVKPFLLTRAQCAILEADHRLVATARRYSRRTYLGVAPEIKHRSEILASVMSSGPYRKLFEESVLGWWHVVDLQAAGQVASVLREPVNDEEREAFEDVANQVFYELTYDCFDLLTPEQQDLIFDASIDDREQADLHADLVVGDWWAREEAWIKDVPEPPRYARELALINAKLDLVVMKLTGLTFDSKAFVDEYSRLMRLLDVLATVEAGGAWPHSGEGATDEAESKPHGDAGDGSAGNSDAVATNSRERADEDARGLGRVESSPHESDGASTDAEHDSHAADGRRSDPAAGEPGPELFPGSKIPFADTLPEGVRRHSMSIWERWGQVDHLDDLELLHATIAEQRQYVRAPEFFLQRTELSVSHANELRDLKSEVKKLDKKLDEKLRELMRVTRELRAALEVTETTQKLKR